LLVLLIIHFTIISYYSKRAHPNKVPVAAAATMRHGLDRSIGSEKVPSAVPHASSALDDNNIIHLTIISYYSKRAHPNTVQRQQEQQRYGTGLFGRLA